MSMVVPMVVSMASMGRCISEAIKCSPYKKRAFIVMNLFKQERRQLQKSQTSVWDTIIKKKVGNAAYLIGLN